MTIGIIQFPCPKCSTPAPVHVAHVKADTHFTCVNVACGFRRVIGDKFPSVTKLMQDFSALDPETARARIVDAMTAWYLDWSDLRAKR